MLLLDVNVVLAAFRADHPAHDVVRPWFDAAFSAGDDIGVPTTVWATFLRLATNRRMFAVPASVAEAFAFVDAVTAHPAYLPVAPGPRHLLLLRRLCDEGEMTGDLVPDAVLGAIALEVGGTLVTLDRDVARMPSVRTLRPG